MCIRDSRIFDWCFLISICLIYPARRIVQAIPEIDQQWRISIKEGTVLNQFGTGGLNDIRNGSVVLMSDLVLVDRTGLHYATCWINQTN